MSKFKIHDAKSSSILATLEDQIGFIPNVFGVLGGNAKALEAFATLNTLFGNSSLSPIEREIVQVAASVVNSCEYCVAGHTAFAHFQDLNSSQITAIRTGEKLADRRLEALRQFAQSLVSTKGRDAQLELEEFLAAGYNREQVFDVVLGVNVKMFSNHVAGLTEIQLDEPFAPFQWSPEDTTLSAA
ncbi:carboxymuconolactone decarboxylase family protein [Lentilitoribacter sp. EG35]|uniref:carboxymuconolactone decarboxylase family protein n=1 Tax=Lentilitoribacter sp. EG35 TaxID=3234192 RepID=UPI00346152B8